MPELPEVERARRLIEETCTGYVIDVVDTVEDTIVYDGTDHLEFAKELRGRTVTGCERKGKQGQEPTWYRRKIHLGETSDSWPPKYHKFVIKLKGPSESSEPRELAFIDPRRLARLRLVPDPVLSHPPLSALGFDPVLNHPTLDEFKELISKKKGTIKGLIMDQAFSAGVGNWVADEVLYHSRIHPQCPVPALTEQEVTDLHRFLREIPQTAVAVNADARQFPDNWLFRWRWGKGKKKASKKKDAEEGDVDIKPERVEFLALPDGTRATIAFVTVGGRTSAVVTELQKLPSGAVIKVPAKKVKKARKRKGDESDSSLCDLSEDAAVAKAKVKTSVKKVTKKKREESDSSLTEDEVIVTKTSRSQRAAARSGVSEVELVKVEVEQKPQVKRRRG